jgi:hypothetical protein
MQPQDFYNEITASKADIEKRINRQVKTIAWPYGYFSPSMTAAAIGANYIGAQSIDQNWCTISDVSLEGTDACLWLTGNAAGQDPFLMKRIYVDGRCTTTEFGVIVSRGWGYLAACAATATPVIAAIAPLTAARIAPAASQPAANIAPPAFTRFHAPYPPRKDDRFRDHVDEDNDGEDRKTGDRKGE